MTPLITGLAITLSLLFGLFAQDQWPVAAGISLATGALAIVFILGILIRRPMQALFLAFPFLFLKTDDRLFLAWITLVFLVLLIQTVELRVDKHRLDRPLLFLIALVLVAAVSGWTRSLDQAEGLLRLGTVFVAPFAAFLIIAKSPTAWRLPYHIPRLLVLCFAIVGLMGLIYKIQHPEVGRVSGYVQMSLTMVGYAGAALIPLALHYCEDRGRRTFNIGVLTFVLLAVMLTNTRMAFLMSGVAIAVNWRKFKGALLAWLLLGGVAAVAVSATLFARMQEVQASTFDISAASRLIAWVVGIEMLLQKPWLGIGLGNFSQLYLANTSTPLIQLIHAHNVLLQLASDIGIVGALAYFAAIARVLFARPPVDALHRALRWTLVIFLMAGATDAIFFRMEWTIWYWVLLGCYWQMGNAGSSLSRLSGATGYNHGGL